MNTSAMVIPPARCGPHEPIDAVLTVPEPWVSARRRPTSAVAWLCYALPAEPAAARSAHHSSAMKGRRSCSDVCPFDCLSALLELPLFRVVLRPPLTCRFAGRRARRWSGAVEASGVLRRWPDGRAPVVYCRERRIWIFLTN